MRSRIIRLHHKITQELIRIINRRLAKGKLGMAGVLLNQIETKLIILKEMGAPIKFSRNRGTYYYNEEGRFRVFLLRAMHSFYKLVLSPVLHAGAGMMGGACRFQPTCCR